MEEKEKPDNGELVIFRTEDRMVYGVMNYDGNELMAEISGFDLRIAFNLRLIHTLSDAEACADGLADVFYEALMEQLIAMKPDFLQPDESKSPILSKDREGPQSNETGFSLPGSHPISYKDEDQ